MFSQRVLLALLLLLPVMGEGASSESNTVYSNIVNNQIITNTEVMTIEIDVKTLYNLAQKSKDTFLELNIGGSQSVRFAQKKLKSRNGIEDFSWYGKPESIDGSIVLSIKDGHMFGSMRLGEDKYKIFPIGNNYFNIIKADPSKMIPFDNDTIIKEYPQEKINQLNLPNNNLEMQVLNNGTSTVKILLLYTQDMADFYGNTLTAFIQNLEDITNQAFDNSLSDTQIDIVHASLYTNVYAAEGYTIGTALNQISNSSEVYSLRSQYSANIVSLLRRYYGNESCGLANLLLVEDKSYSRDYSYNVVQVKQSSEGSGYYCSDFTFAHEIGHNLGCVHDRDHSSGAGIYSYSYGYDIPGILATIMSYDSPTIEYFSNPNITYLGHAIGIAENNSDSADCAGTIQNTRNFVAQNMNFEELLESGDNISNNLIQGYLETFNDRDSYWVGLGGETTIDGADNYGNTWGIYLNIYTTKGILIGSYTNDFMEIFANGQYLFVVSFTNDATDTYWNSTSENYSVQITTNYVETSQPAALPAIINYLLN